MSTSGWVPPDTFADRLMRARKGRKLTVEKAAAKAGVSPATWSTWERGAHPRDLAEVVQRVSAGLEVDRDWLLWGNGMLPGSSPVTTSGWSGRTRQVERPLERRRDWARRERWDRESQRVPAQRMPVAA